MPSRTCASARPPRHASHHAELVQVEVDAGRMLLWTAARQSGDCGSRSSASRPPTSPSCSTGETGTGKELVARILHRLSARPRHELVAARLQRGRAGHARERALRPRARRVHGRRAERSGRFELADGGTLFLDEIGELPLELQAKLLRVLQEREVRAPRRQRDCVRVDVRVIAATNVDLAADVRAGRFRDDLFYRLNVVPLHLPPLRERREDIALLVEPLHHPHAPAAAAARGASRVARRAATALRAYDWPGNVRELENVVETAMLECDGDSIEPSHLHFEGGASAARIAAEDLEVTFREARHHALQAFERLYLLGQLRRFRGRITDVARHAGVTTKHVRELMKRHGIDRRDFRPPLRRSSVRRSSKLLCRATRGETDAPRGALVLVARASAPR